MVLSAIGTPIYAYIEPDPLLSQNKNEHIKSEVQIRTFEFSICGWDQSLFFVNHPWVSSILFCEQVVNDNIAKYVKHLVCLIRIFSMLLLSKKRKICKKKNKKIIYRGRREFKHEFKSATTGVVLRKAAVS